MLVTLELPVMPSLLEQVEIDVEGVEPNAQQDEDDYGPHDRLDERRCTSRRAPSITVRAHDSLFFHGCTSLTQSPHLITRSDDSTSTKRARLFQFPASCPASPQEETNNSDHVVQGNRM